MKTGAETVKPIFDWSIPDWEYYAMISEYAEHGKNWVDHMAMIYKDGDFKIKGRLKFSSGSKLIGDKTNSYRTLDEAIEAAKFITIWAEEFERDLGLRPKNVRSHVILNTTTKGQDLFQAMQDSGILEFTYTKGELNE